MAGDRFGLRLKAPSEDLLFSGVSLGLVGRGTILHYGHDDPQNIRKEGEGGDEQLPLVAMK